MTLYPYSPRFSVRDDQYLARSADVDKIHKAYKKAVLKIHPDKVNSSDFEAHLKANEMFKAVNASYELFKKKESESRHDEADTETSFGFDRRSSASGSRTSSAFRKR